MKCILKYFVFPLLAFAGCVIALVYDWKYSPLLVIFLIVGLFAYLLIQGYYVRGEYLRRGWRVGHEGRDEFVYEEFVDGCWE